jgi:tRNA/tmRNA/rRNA uracil-C5-methylase (TrmA/RlmC/RlmD family)
LRRQHVHHARDMKSGDQLQIEITDLAYGGSGLGRQDGRVIFVPFVIPGERVTARIVRVTRQWAAAEPLAIENPSPDRVEPPCPFFTRCGGCAYQHIAYPRQLEIKTRQVAETLRRLGKITDPPVEPARPSPREYHYRNRITVQVRPPVIGFHSRGSDRLIEIDRCLLAVDDVNEALRRLRSKKYLRPGPATLRTGAPDEGFRQVNDEAAPLLAAEVATLAGCGDILIDAYCGAGFFAKKLLSGFSRVIGIDWDERAINTARHEALPTEDYRAGNTAELLPGVLREFPGAVALLDPPAQGLAPEVIEALLTTPPARIVYVSCDPATLARDIAALSSAFRPARVIPLDMFPQTASIEVACLLEPAQS